MKTTIQKIVAGFLFLSIFMSNQTSVFAAGYINSIIDEKQLAVEFEEAMKDETIGLTENDIQSMVKISSEKSSLDEEYGAEITNYRLNDVDVLTASSSAHQVKYARSWRVYRKKDNVTMVKFTLDGLFVYNGKKVLVNLQA